MQSFEIQQKSQLETTKLAQLTISAICFLHLDLTLGRISLLKPWQIFFGQFYTKTATVRTPNANWNLDQTQDLWITVNVDYHVKNIFYGWMT